MNLICPAGYPAGAMNKDDEKLGFEFKFNKGLVKLPLLADAQTRNYEDSVMKVLAKSEQRREEAFL